MEDVNEDSSGYESDDEMSGPGGPAGLCEANTLPAWPRAVMEPQHEQTKRTDDLPARYTLKEDGLLTIEDRNILERIRTLKN